MLCTASYSLTLVRDSKPDSVACIYVVILVRYNLDDPGRHSDGVFSGTVYLARLWRMGTWISQRTHHYQVWHCVIILLLCPYYH